MSPRKVAGEKVDLQTHLSSQKACKTKSANVARSHDDNGGGEDRPLHTMYPAVAWVALLIEAKANETPIWAVGQRAG
nr:hypothetical protein [Tanacetum cinerariifolium]